MYFINFFIIHSISVHWHKISTCVSFSAGSYLFNRTFVNKAYDNFKTIVAETIHLRKVFFYYFLLSLSIILVLTEIQNYIVYFIF